MLDSYELKSVRGKSIKDTISIICKLIKASNLKNVLKSSIIIFTNSDNININEQLKKL